MPVSAAATAEATATIDDTPHCLTLQDRVVIVTGGSRGIGRGIALHLAQLGARVVVAYASSATDADGAVSAINSFPPSPALTQPRAIAVRANVSDAADVKALFDAAEAFGGGAPAYVLVNSAGVLDSTYPPISATSEEEWERIFETNAKGTFLCCREAANRLRRGGGGRIINISSSLVAALRPGYGAYIASKAAVDAMTKILAKELKGSCITANCVAPGPVATEMFFAGKTPEVVERITSESPMGRLGTPEDVAAVVGFLAGDSGLWVNGQVIRVNGGYI
ncbi:NADPH-dependent aldehyde reductase-like protein, chloroplastic [Nymphaea colorata]|uniref:Ketoreductase domain-containing protein n=1 Tax=Nymphaea colorata TaxID=210225 RepID=A0A5K1A879_9MAGN|nr:NADPH-dependent aldehyde reductase-like protein, chloroplastic [Nymphaea colorata]